MKIVVVFLAIGYFIFSTRNEIKTRLARYSMELVLAIRRNSCINYD